MIFRYELTPTTKDARSQINAWKGKDSARRGHWTRQKKRRQSQVDYISVGLSGQEQTGLPKCRTWMDQGVPASDNEKISQVEGKPRPAVENVELGAEGRGSEEIPSC
jgi:hypothetical protein